MKIPTIKGAICRFKNLLPQNRDRVLREAKGVIHIGASTGQERDIYQKYDLDVVWIEPIPDVFKKLQKNIKNYSQQKAFQYLITDKDGAEYQFNISTNKGMSSSIYDLKHHKDIWPEITYKQAVSLKSITLPTMLIKEQIDISKYDALIVDTQGSELLVLRGATQVLTSFKFIKTEVPDFEAYAGCCQLPELTGFLNSFGFKENSRYRFAHTAGIGSYYDIIYINRKAQEKL